MSHPSINKMSAADIEAAQLKFYNEFRKKTAGRIKRGKPPSKATLKKRFQKEFEPIVVVDNIHRISKKSKHFQCSISKTVEIGEISYEAANNNTVTTSSSLDVPNLVVQSASSVDNTDNSVTTYKKTVPKLIHVSRPVVSTVKNSCVETSDDKRMSEVSKNRLDKAKDTSKNDMNPPKSLLKLSKDSSNEWKLSDTSKLENTDVNVGLYSSSRKTVSCDTAKPTYTVSTASVITTSKCNTHSATLEESGNHIKLKFSLHPSTSNFPRSQNHKNSVSRTVTSTVSKTIPQQSPAMSRTLPNHNETRTVSQTIANSPINQTCVQGVSGSHLRLTKGEISALIGTGQARPQYTSNMSKGVDAVRTLSSPQPSLLQQECVDKVYFSKPPLANISSDSFTEPQMRKAKTISYEQYIQRRESQKHNSDGKRSSSNVQKSVPHADYISKYRQSIAFPGGHIKTPVTSSVSEKISYSSTISGYSPQAAPKKGILKHPQSKSHGHKPTSNHYASQNLNNQKEHGKPSHIRKTLATAVKPSFHKNVSPKIVPNSQPFIYSSNDKASVIQLSPEEMEKQRQFVKEYNLKTLSKPSVGNPQVQPNVEGLKSSHPKGSVLAKKPVIIPLNPVVPSSIKPRPINNVNEGKALKSNVDVARNESQIRSTSIQLENKSTSHSFVSKREVIICSDKSRERSCSQIANTLDVCSPNIQEHKSKLEVFNRQSSEDIPTQLSKSDSKTVSNSETGKKPIPQKSAEPKKSGDNLFEKILEKESILSESTTDNEKAEQIGENNTKTNISNDILNANKDREHRTNSSNIFENFAEIEIVSFDDSKEEESSPVTSPNVSDNVDDPKDKKASPLDSMNVSNDLDDPKDKKSSSLDSLNVFNDCDDFKDKISIKSSNVSNPLDDPKEEKSSSPDSSNLSNDFDDPNEEKSRPLDSSNMSNDFEEKSRPLDSSNVSNDFDKSKEEKSYQLDSSNISNDLDEPKEKSSPPESSNLSNDSDGFLWDDLEEIEDLSHNASVKPVFVVPDAPESDRKSKNVFSNIFGDFGRRQHSINTNLGSEFDIPSSPFHQMHEVVAKIICNPELSDDEQDFDENLLAKPPEEKNKNRDYNQIISCGQDVTNLKTNDLEHVHNKKVEMTVNDEVAADVPNKDSGQENPVLIVDAQQKHLSTPKPPINVNIVEKCTSNMFSNLSRSEDESSKIVMSDHIDDVVVTKGIASSTPIETDNRMLSRTEVSAITPIAEKWVTSTSTVTDNKQSEMCHENVHDASTTDCDTPKTKTTESSIVPGIVSECSRYGQQKDALNIEKITDYAVTETVSSSDDAKCVPFASMKCQNMPQSSGADSTSVQSLQDLKLQATVFTDNDNENVNATQTVSTDTDKVMDSAQKDYQYDMKCSKADFPIENSVKFDEKEDVKLNSSDESKFIENSADTAAKSDENVSAVSSVGITYNKVTDADDTDKGTSSKDFETVDVSISEMHKEPIEQDEHVIENETAKSVESILEKLESIEAEVNDSSKVPKPNREENAVDISNSSDGNENNINHVKDNENITTSQIIANVSDETNTGVQNVVDSRCIESGEDITVIIEQQERENTSSDIILNDLSIIENDNEVAIKVQESTSDVATKSDQSEQECNMSLVTILSDQIESAVEKNNINKKSDLVVKDPESLSDSEHAIEDKVVEDSTIGNPCSELEFSFTVCGAMGSQKSHAESTSDSESNALHTSGIQNSSYEKDQNDAKSESPKVESLIIKLSAEDSESMESELAVNKEENSNEPEKHLESSSKSNEQDCPKVNIGHKLKKSIPKISIVDIGKLIGLPDRENRDKVLTKTVNISKMAVGTLQNNMGENVTLLDMHSKKSGQVEEIPMKIDTVSAGDSESKDESEKSDTCEPLGQVEKCAINSTNDTSAEKVDEMETSTELSNADTNSKSGQSHISLLNETSSSIQDNSEQDMEDNMATSALDYYDAKDDFDIQEDVLEIALADALQEEHALCSEENANSIITPDLESPSQNATQSSNAESLGAERNEVDEIKEDEIATKFISIDTDKNEDHGSGIVTDYGSESDIFAKEQIKFYEVNKQKDDGDKNFHDLELQVQYDFKETEECPEEKTEVRTPTDVDSLSNVLTDFFGEDGSSGESDDHSEKKVIGKECSEAVGNDKSSDDEGQTKSNAKPIDSIVEEIAPENPCKADETGQKESNGVDDSKPVDEAEDGEKVDIYESKENPLHGNALDQDSVQEQAVLTTERILLQSDNLADGTVDLGLNEKEASILETTTERCLKDIDEILENKSANSVKDQIQCTNVNNSEIVTSHIHEEPMDPSQTHEDISKSISLSASVDTPAVHDIAATKHSSENEKQLQISDVHVDCTIAQQGLENVTNKDTVSSESVNVAPSVPSSPLDDDVNEMCRIIVLENVDKALKEDDLLSICKQTPDQEKIGNDIEKTICELSCDKMECNEDLIMECEEELTLEKRNEPYSITQVAKTKENKEDKESQSIVEGQLEERESQKFNIDDLDSSNGIEDVQSQASSEIVSKIMDDLVDKSFVVVSEPSKSLQLTLKRVSKEECAVKKRKQKQITMSTGEIGSRNDPTGQMNCHTDAPTSQDSTNFEEAISSKDDCESSITTDVNDINYDNDVNNSTKKPKSYLKIPNLEARKKKYMYSPSIYDFPEETSDSLIGIAPQKFASPLKDIDEEYDNEDETDSLTRIEPERFTSPLKDIDEEHSEDGSSLPHTVEDGYMSPETISSQNLKYSDVSLSKVSDVIGENVNKTSDAKESSSMIDLNAKRSTKIGENYQIEQNLKLKECFVNLGEKPTKHKNVGEKLPIASDTTKQALSSDNSANANLNKQPRKRKKPATNNESKIKKKLVPKQAEKNLGLNVKEKKSSKSKSLKAKRLKKKLKSTQGKDKSDGEDLDSEEQVNMLIRDINDSLEKNKTNSETEHEKINQNFMSEDGESNETTNNVCDNPISSEENVTTNINNTSETSNQSSEKDKIVLKIPKKMLAGTEGSSPADVKNTTSRSPHQQPIQAPDDEDDMPTILPNKRRRLKDRVHEVEEEKLMIDRINSEFPSHNWLERKIASGENVVKNPSAKSKLDVYIESHSDTNKDMDNLVMDLSNQIDQPERMEEDEILPSEVHPDATNTEKFDIADPCSTEAEAKANAKSKPNGEKQKRSVKKSCKPLTSSKGKGLAKNKLVGSSKAKGCSVRENTTVPTARVTPNNLNESGNGHPPPLRPIINIHTGEVIPSTATVPFIQISSPTFTPVITVNQPTDLSIKRPSDGITETLPAKIIKVEGTRTFPLSHMPTMGTVVQNISTQPIFIQPQNNGQTIPQVMLANSSIPVSIQTSVPQSHNLSVQSDAVGNLSMTSGLIIPTSSVPIGVQNIIPQSHTVNMHTNSTANVPIAPQPEAINIIPMTMSTCSKTPPNSSAFQSSASSTTPNRQTGQVTPIMSTHIMSPSESLHQNKDASINQVRIGAGSAEVNMQNSPSTSALANETPQTSNETASLSRQAQMDAGTSPGKNSGQLSDHEKLLQQEYSKIFNKLQELNKIEEIKEKERLLLSKMKQKASLLLKMIQDQVIKCKTTGKETVTEVIDLTSRDTDSPVDYSVPTVPQTSTVDLIKPSNPPVQAQDLRIERSESTDSETSSIMMFPGISHKPPLPLHVLNPYHQRTDMVIAPENQETRKLEGLRPSRAHNHQTIVKFVISTGPLEAHTKNHVNFGSITNMYCKYAQNRIPKKPMVSEPLNFSEMGKNLSINKSMPCKSENVLDSSSLSPSNVPVSKPVSSTKDSVKELDAHKARKLQPLNIRQLKKPAKKPATVTSEDVHPKETTLFEKPHSISPKVTTAAQPIGSSNSSNSSSSSLNVHLTNISQVRPLGTSPGALPVVISPVATNISPSVSTAQVRQQPASSSNNPNVKHMLPSNQNAQQRIMPKDISTPTVVSVHPNVPASSHVNIPNTHAFIRPNISGMNTSRPQVKPNPAQIFNLSPKHTRPQLAANQMRYFAPQSQVQQQQQQPQQQQLLQQQQQQQQLLQQQQQRQLMQQQQQQQQAQHQQQFHLQQVQQQQQMQQIQLQPQNMQNMGHMPQTLAGQNMIFSRFPTAAQSYGGGMGGANTNQAVPQQNMAFGRQQMQTNIFNSNPPAYEAHIPAAQTTVATGTASNLKLSVSVPVSLPGTGTGKAQPNPAGGPPSLCDVCASKAKFVCSGCKAVSYCSGDCQHKAWPMHSLQCKK